MKYKSEVNELSKYSHIRLKEYDKKIENLQKAIVNLIFFEIINKKILGRKTKRNKRAKKKERQGNSPKKSSALWNQSEFWQASEVFNFTSY